VFHSFLEAINHISYISTAKEARKRRKKRRGRRVMTENINTEDLFHENS
jgi:hypothetical protein